MNNDKYDYMSYSELKCLYAERCEYMGIKNPPIPGSRKDLVTMLTIADTFGVPQDANTNPTESIRKAIVGILGRGIEEAKRRGKTLPILVSG